MKLFFWLFSSIFFLNSYASEKTFITLGGQFRYKDKSFSCETSSLFNKVYFLAEIENDRPIKASLNKYANYSSPSTTLYFNEEELEGVIFYKDFFGKYWLKEIKLSERLAIWTLHNLGDFLCSIPQKIKALNQPFLIFFFDTENLGLEIVVSRSNEEEFKGTLVNDNNFEASLVLEETLK